MYSVIKDNGMTIKEIVLDYLKEHSFDGLAGDECGCGIDDFAPCGEMRSDCQPAYKYKCVCCGKCDCGQGDDCFSVEEPEGRINGEKETKP